MLLWKAFMRGNMPGICNRLHRWHGLKIALIWCTTFNESRFDLVAAPCFNGDEFSLADTALYPCWYKTLSQTIDPP